MSRPAAGYVGFSRSTVGGYPGFAPGVWTLREAQSYRGAGTWPSATNSDPFFSNVTLLLHMDGTGSAFSDSSASPKTITALGNITQSSAQSKFGGKSCSSDGTNSYMTFASSAMNFAAQNFVVEWFQYIASSSLSGSNGGQIGLWGNGRRSGITEGMCCYVQSFSSGLNRIQVDGLIGGSWVSPFLISSSSYVPFSWQHCAVVRSGSAFALYIDGQRQASATGTSVSSPATSSASLFSTSGGGEFLASGRQAYIDEFRVTIGTDRSYSGTSIVVPSVAFADSV